MFRLDLHVSVLLLLLVFYLPYHGPLDGKNRIIQLLNQALNIN